MDDNELEYRLPAKVLTNRDPILLNKLSIREFFQWTFFFGLIYLDFNLLPVDFYIRLIIGAVLVTFAALFIHAPINGLAGIEWVYIWLRFRLERQRHLTVAPLEVDLAGQQRPVFQVSLSLAGRAQSARSRTAFNHQAAGLHLDSSDTLETVASTDVGGGAVQKLEN